MCLVPILARFSNKVLGHPVCLLFCIFMHFSAFLYHSHLCTILKPLINSDLSKITKEAIYSRISSWIQVSWRLTKNCIQLQMHLSFRIFLYIVLFNIQCNLFTFFFSLMLDGPIRGESLGLKEFALMILEPMAKPTVLKCRCHHF